MESENKSCHETLDALGDEMELYAENYKCNKCNEFYCSHMLKAMASKFKKKTDIEIGKMINVISA